MEAISKYADSLQFIPIVLRKQEICLEAIKHNAYALKFVSNKYFEDIEFLTCIKLIYQDKIELNISVDLLQIESTLFSNLVKKQVNVEKIKDFIQKYLQDDSKYSLTYKGKKYETTIKDSFVRNKLDATDNALEHPDILEFLDKTDLSALSSTNKHFNKHIGLKKLDFKDIASGYVKIGKEEAKLINVAYDNSGFSLELVSKDLAEESEIGLVGDTDEEASAAATGGFEI